MKIFHYNGLLNVIQTSYKLLIQRVGVELSEEEIEEESKFEEGMIKIEDNSGGEDPFGDDDDDEDLEWEEDEEW